MSFRVNRLTERLDYTESVYWLYLVGQLTMCKLNDTDMTMSYKLTRRLSVYNTPDCNYISFPDIYYPWVPDSAPPTHRIPFALHQPEGVRMWTTESFRKKFFRHQNPGGSESGSRWLVLFTVTCTFSSCTQMYSKSNQRPNTRNSKIGNVWYSTNFKLKKWYGMPLKRKKFWDQSAVRRKGLLWKVTCSEADW